MEAFFTFERVDLLVLLHERLGQRLLDVVEVFQAEIIWADYLPPLTII